MDTELGMSPGSTAETAPPGANSTVPQRHAPLLPDLHRPLRRRTDGGFYPTQLDTLRPHPARIEDHLLGGHNNYPPDRDAGEEIKAVMPDAPATLRANRAYLENTVNTLLAQGVRQFLDIGAGLRPATVQPAEHSGVATRLALVDNDPVAVAHLQGCWERDDSVDGLLRAIALYGDLRWPETFTADLRLLHLLDPDAPIAVILAAVLQHIPDSDGPRDAVSWLMRDMPAGSRLVITHATGDPATPQDAEEWAQAYATAASPLVLRSRGQIAGFFEGLELADPGVHLLDAQPVDQGTTIRMYGAIGVKA